MDEVQMTPNLTQLTFKESYHYLKEWWQSDEKKVAWMGLLVLLLTSVFSVYIAVVFNNWNRDFYQAIQDKNVTVFLHQVYLFFPLLSVLIFDFCFRNYLTMWLGFRWRRYLTFHLKKRWLRSKAYYLMPLLQEGIDNPDQRIANDVDSVCVQGLSLFFSFYRELISSVVFIVILWGLSDTLTYTVFGHSLRIPGFLVWAVLLYSLLSIVITFKIGRPLIGLDVAQERLEAQFRYRLMRIFERREEIAKFSAEAFENNRLNESFYEVMKNYLAILKRNVYINLFQNFYLNGSQFIPIILVGPMYFSGTMTLGVMMQIVNIFSTINNSLVVVATGYTQIANWLGSFKRLQTFEKGITHAQERLPILSNAPQIQLEQLRILKPNREEIWAVPALRVNAGERKLLMAHSGRGKSSLLRVLAGLYPFYEGNIQVPSGLMIVPQRTYMPLGTLRQCLAYPSETVTDERVLPILADCQLSHLAERLDEDADHIQQLSLGEQQRINFARVLLHRPEWILLDEPTAHLNITLAEKLMHLLVTTLPNAAILAISHQLLPYFHTVIDEHGVESGV